MPTDPAPPLPPDPESLFLPTEDWQTDEEAFADLDTTPATPDLVVSDAPPPPIGRSWAFDFVMNPNGPGFERGPLAGTVATTNGDDTLYYWIIKALRTAKGAHAIYPSDFGMRDPFALIGRTVTGADLAQFETDIHDALTFHPRIANVTGFDTFHDPNDEVLWVSFTVVKDDGTTLKLDTMLVGGIT